MTGAYEKSEARYEPMKTSSYKPPPNPVTLVPANDGGLYEKSEARYELRTYENEFVQTAPQSSQAYEKSEARYELRPYENEFVQTAPQSSQAYEKSEARYDPTTLRPYDPLPVLPVSTSIAQIPVLHRRSFLLIAVDLSGGVVEDHLPARIL